MLHTHTCPTPFSEGLSRLRIKTLASLDLKVLESRDVKARMVLSDYLFMSNHLTSQPGKLRGREKQLVLCHSWNWWPSQVLEL